MARTVFTWWPPRKMNSQSPRMASLPLPPLRLSSPPPPAMRSRPVSPVMTSTRLPGDTMLFVLRRVILTPLLFFFE
jgi:hypothetical protein